MRLLVIVDCSDDSDADWLSSRVEGIDDANMSPIRRMACRSCGARWVRPGL
jgi:hypothetical protein